MTPPGDSWSPWEPLPLEVTAPVLRETLDGGQAFRWKQEEAGWLGLWSDCAAKLRLTDNRLEASFPKSDARPMREHLHAYLRLDTNFETLAGDLPQAADPHIRRCVGQFPGLRILRQPLAETLLGFLCSATKQISQIKQMLAFVAERHGASIPGAPDIRRLPSWEEIARLKEADLRGCLLGFRARYVHETALFLKSRPGWLESLAALPYPEAKERLRLLPGVGDKIADCVLLFGAGRLEAFPVDVWILKAMAGRYGLQGWRPAQVAHFGRVHFGPLAGLAQQYLFAFERFASRSPVRTSG